MTTDQIRSFPTNTLRQIVNGMEGIADKRFNDPIVRHIASDELRRRGI